jgi:hypothetical protein
LAPINWSSSQTEMFAHTVSEVAVALAAIYSVFKLQFLVNAHTRSEVSVGGTSS